MPTDVLAELKSRGLLYQCTDEAGLREHLRTPRRVYCGFDPTADSLTIGNLVPIMLLAHFQRAGHTPVVVMGGGTGLIGDPSGKTTERTMMTRETVAENVSKQRPIFESILDFSPSTPNRAIRADNAEWLTRLPYIDVLRDVGKHFSVNMMIQKDSVKARLESREQGISYTEFSYMILQSYDFLHLHRDLGVTIQLGGSDQWGNIVAGADLIRRVGAQEGATGHQAIEAAHENPHAAFGLTAPLVTKADGGKFGKTETGAIWLTAARTSPYAYYQFWLNASDADVIKFLNIFTFVPTGEIVEIERAHTADPGKREAQRRLAREATKVLHGEAAMHHAEAAGQALFSGDIAHLDKATLEEVFASVPSTTHSRAELAAHSTNPSADQPGLPLVDLLPLTSLCKSKREAREHLQAGAVTVNGRAAGIDDRLTVGNLLHGELALLRRGKKAWHVTRWQ